MIKDRQRLEELHRSGEAPSARRCPTTRTESNETCRRRITDSSWLSHIQSVSRTKVWTKPGPRGRGLRSQPAYRDGQGAARYVAPSVWGEGHLAHGRRTLGTSLPTVEEEVDSYLAAVMSRFGVAAASEPPVNTGDSQAEEIFLVLTSRQFSHLSRSEAAPYRPRTVTLLEESVRRGEPVSFWYDIGPGYHASTRPGERDLSFGVGLSELLVLSQIASFSDRVVEDLRARSPFPACRRQPLCPENERHPRRAYGWILRGVPRADSRGGARGQGGDCRRVRGVRARRVRSGSCWARSRAACFAPLGRRSRERREIHRTALFNRRGRRQNRQVSAGGHGHRASADSCRPRRSHDSAGNEDDARFQSFPRRRLPHAVRRACDHPHPEGQAPSGPAHQPESRQLRLHPCELPGRAPFGDLASHLRPTDGGVIPGTPVR